MPIDWDLTGRLTQLADFIRWLEREKPVVAELESSLVIPLNDPLFRIIEAKYPIDGICASVPIAHIPADLQALYKLKFG